MNFRRWDEWLTSEINGVWRDIGTFTTEELVNYLYNLKSLDDDIYTTSKRPMRFVGCENTYTECGECGTYNPIDAKYCWKCGEKLYHNELFLNEIDFAKIKRYIVNHSFDLMGLLSLLILLMMIIKF